MKREQVYANRFLCGKVKRYHTWPMLVPQSNGEHAWRVACLYVELFGMPRAEVLVYCLHHDSGELWAGDLPWPSKHKRPEIGKLMHNAEREGMKLLGILMPEITADEKLRIKICDLLEMHETGIHEMHLGNQYAEPIAQDTLNLAIEMSLQHKDINDAIAKFVQGASAK